MPPASEAHRRPRKTQSSDDANLRAAPHMRTFSKRFFRPLRPTCGVGSCDMLSRSFRVCSLSSCRNQHMAKEGHAVQEVQDRFRASDERDQEGGAALMRLPVIESIPTDKSVLHGGQRHRQHRGRQSSTYRNALQIIADRRPISRRQGLAGAATRKIRKEWAS